MHEKLEQQIAHHLGGDREKLPSAFLEAVDRAYRDADRALGSAGPRRPAEHEEVSADREPSRADSAALLRATLEATADGILVIGKNGAVVEYNSRFLEIWGLQPADLVGDGNAGLRKARALLLDAEGFLSMLRRLYRDEKTQDRDVVRLVDGRILERYSIPQRVDGEHIGRVWSFRDVTEHQRLEAQIRQSQKMEAVGRVAGGVAHDFNNLLTVIKGYCDLCQRQLGQETGPVAKSLGQISKAAAQAAEMTGQLLAFSRQQEIAPTVLDLHGVIRDFSPMMRRLIDEDVELRFELEAEMALALMDPGRFQQILLNLVINARDALAGGGTICVGTEDIYLVPGPGSPFGEDLPPGHYLLLKVRDDGSGMADAVRSQIFEPFFTTKSKGRGTGLGLATVYGIVKQCGGAICVDSELGRGTEFMLAFPLQGSPEPGEPLEAPEPLASDRRATILVVEDEEPVRLMLDALLREQGHEVILAEGPEEATRIFQDAGARVEVLVTDIVMPGMYGPELADRLKSERPDLAVLYISGYDPAARERRGAPRPGGAFLQKPFDAMTLERKIQAVLRARPTNSPLTS